MSKNYISERQDEASSPSDKINSGGLHGLPQSSGSTIVFSGEEFEYEWSSSLDYYESSIPVFWLNLLWLEPEFASSEDQPRWVGLPVVSQRIYDILLDTEFGHTLRSLEEKLKQTYPESFLFRLDPSQIEHRRVHPRPLTIREFVEQSHQILCVDSSHSFEGEISLSELGRKAYSRIPDQRRSSILRQIDDEIEELRLRGVLGSDSLFIFPFVERQDEASSPSDKINSGGLHGLPQSSGSDWFLNSWGQPVIKNGNRSRIDYHTANKHPFLLNILRFVMKRVGKTARHSHLRRT